MSRQSAFGHLKGPVLVSACLLGVPCRYDGKSKLSREIRSLRNIVPIPICPEQLGGLPTPRQSASLTGGDGRDVLKGLARVVNSEGADVTSLFMKGALITLEIAAFVNTQWAILKDGSPSCATRYVRSDGIRVPGKGVTTALLLDNGITVMNEEGKP